MFVDKL